MVCLDVAEKEDTRPPCKGNTRTHASPLPCNFENHGVSRVAHMPAAGFHAEPMVDPPCGLVGEKDFADIAKYGQCC